VFRKTERQRPAGGRLPRPICDPYIGWQNGAPLNPPGVTRDGWGQVLYFNILSRRRRRPGTLGQVLYFNIRIGAGRRMLKNKT
jgi:hypothetical protein